MVPTAEHAYVLYQASLAWPPSCTDSPSAEPRRDERVPCSAAGLGWPCCILRPAAVLSLSLSLSLSKTCVVTTFLPWQRHTRRRWKQRRPSFPAAPRRLPPHLSSLLSFRSIYTYSCVTDRDHISVNLSMFACGQPLCACISLTLATFQYAIRIVYCRFWIFSLVQSILPVTNQTILSMKKFISNILMFIVSNNCVSFDSCGIYFHKH